MLNCGRSFCSTLFDLIVFSLYSSSHLERKGRFIGTATVNAVMLARGTKDKTMQISPRPQTLGLLVGSEPRSI